jgi:hypothetical protein
MKFAKRLIVSRAIFFNISLMKEKEGNNMKPRIFVLFFLILAFFSNIYAGEKFSLHFACAAGLDCIDLAGNNSIKESIQATPAIEFAKTDIASANVQRNGPGSLLLMITLSKETSKKFEKITRENIGKKLMIVFDNRILATPTINMPISGGQLGIGDTNGENSTFWKNSPWLEDLIKDSNQSRGHSIRLYVIASLATALFAAIFVLLPRFKQVRTINSE